MSAAKRNKQNKKRASVVHAGPPRNAGGDAAPQSGRGNALIVLLLLVITAVVFSNSLANGFIIEHDDDIYVVDNTAIRDLSAAGLKTIFTAFVAGNYHPLTMLSYAIEFRLFGLDPRAYHRTNLLLHGLNVVLAFVLAWSLLRRRSAAFLVALLFAVHPMHVESVSWISERKDVLYAFFFLAALVAYVSYLKDRRRFGRLGGTFILFLLSLLSKPMAVTLPVILLLVDAYLHRKMDHRAWLEKVPFFIAAAVFGLLALATQEPGATLQVMSGRYSFIQRLLFPFYALAFYLAKLVFPFGLSAYHYYPPAAGGYLPWEYYAAPLVLLLAVLAVVAARGWLRRELLFGLLFFLVTISVTLQVIPTGRAVAAERYTYIPYLGPFLVLGLLFDRALRKGSAASGWRRPAAWTAAVFVVLALACASHRRNETWRDSLAVFSDVIAKNPGAGHAYFLRGIIHYNQTDYGAAMADYERASELGFHSAKLSNNQAILKGMNRDYRGALADLDRALVADPRFVEALANRGNVKAALNDPQGAVEDYEQALRLEPRYANAYYGLGRISYARGDMRTACAHWRRAAELGSGLARDLLASLCK